ncbi:unnamed protein product, partial [Allacma fusca]
LLKSQPPQSVRVCRLNSVSIKDRGYKDSDTSTSGGLQDLSNYCQASKSASGPRCPHMSHNQENSPASVPQPNWSLKR